MSDECGMVWQLDFYRRPLRDVEGNPLWELLICDVDRSFTYGEFCAQPNVGAPWIRQQLEKAKDRAGKWPKAIEIFRPQTIGLVEVACRELPVSARPNRDTPALKQWLVQRAAWYPSLKTYAPDAATPNTATSETAGSHYHPTALERPAPVPVADHLMGDLWQFAAVSSGDLQRLCQEPIPIQAVPLELSPVTLGLPSTLPIPGVIIDGGRQSMVLARWLQSANPVMLQYIAGMPDGLLLEAGLVDRWILATFEDEDVAAAARTFTERKIAAKGLHFLLVRPDDSGVTYTGLWLLRQTPGKEIARASVASAT